jgi:DNA-directed RNA polymerase subunit K/omega
MKNNTPIRENNMISPPMDTLTHQGEFNRYELVIATAKGARVVTEEYIEMRSKAEKMKSDKETDKPLLSLIDGEYRDQKPVRIAITRLQDGKYSMERPAEEETEEEGAAEAEAPAEEG